jgi:hypothetical protein
MNTVLRHIRANFIAYLALFLALSMGTAWALEKNSVKSKHIVNEQVKGKDLAKRIPYDFTAHGAESAATSEDKSITVQCPGGKIPFGGAGYINGGEGYVAISESRFVWPPLTAEPGWRVTAIEVNGGTSEDWIVGAATQCAKIKA